MNWRKLYYPTNFIYQRLRSIKLILCLGMVASALISYKLFLGIGNTVPSPLFSNLQNLHPLILKIVFGFFILLPILMVLSQKPKVFTLLFLFVAAFFLVTDTNRLQPWFFQYLIMFFVLAFYNWRVDEPKKFTPVFNTLKLCMVLIYVWSGINKLNIDFAHTSWPLMLQPAHSIFTPAQIQFFLKAGFIIPFIEILAGVALFFPTIKRIGIPLLLAVHLIDFLLLGPFAHNENPGMFPLYFANMFFLYFLFAGRAESKFHHISSTLQFKPAFLVVILLGVLPIFNLSGNIPVKLFGKVLPSPKTKSTIEITHKTTIKTNQAIALKFGKSS